MSKTNNSRNIGARLRAVRAAKNLTLEQLSNIAGVSKSMISQIEQGKANPTVALMLKMADALEMEIGSLLDQGPRKNILYVLYGDDKHYTLVNKSERFEIRTLSPLDREKDIEFYLIKLGVGGEHVSQPHFVGAEEFLYVVSGKLLITSADEETELSSADSVYYKADVIHSMKNVGDKEAEAFLVVHFI
ncbi:MAG: helix-turn-helix transcriptional regulator [Sedimentisphaerales bacterium]|nr:helix-turn-helix transcriptional regulator [Sedimentisphaerales bacterium]